MNPQDHMYPQDPKMQGQPPPYSMGPPPPVDVQPQVVHGTTYIHATTVPTVVPVVVGQQMGPKPTPMICKSCNQQIVTRVQSKPTLRTHLFAALLCLLVWPCFWIPYCVDSCSNSDHYCPHCNAYIGSYIS